MTPLLIKSNDNYLAAKLLIEKGHPNSSVHCCYYSCVQLMLHILMKNYGETEDSLRIVGDQLGKGSHETAIKLLCDHLRKMQVSVRDFNNNINELKIKRTDIDYKHEIIDVDGGRQVRQKAKTVIDFLKEKFSI